MTAIVQRCDHKLLAIGGMPDHVHLFFGMRPRQSLSDLMQRVKGDSSIWINKRGLTRKRFSWQGGYSGFSYAKSLVPTIVRYVHNQEAYHRKKTMREEYLSLLKEFEVSYDEKYIFQEVLKEY